MCFPVLWMTSCLHITERMSQNQGRHTWCASKNNPPQKNFCISAMVIRTGGSSGPGWAMPPGHVGKRPECSKSRHFQTQNRKNFLGRGNAPSQTPASFPLHKSQRLFTLVLSPRAICIHITASFPTSNGFLRLKRFKQSMEE